MRKEKPLGIKAYGSIPHLPGSRRGPADKGLSDDQAAILTSQARDQHDVIIVQEKLDGSCVSVAKLNGEIVPLMRAGYRAKDSHYEMHHLFHDWVMQNKSRFDCMINEGERCVGEWLAQAHGTLYTLARDPFVPFDIMRGHNREISERANLAFRLSQFQPAYEIHRGGPCSVQFVLEHFITQSGHGAVGGMEGAVWRCERKGVVDFLGKFVRQDKVDGCFLPEKNGGVPTWNWRPS